jgi:hypothetical protein
MKYRQGVTEELPGGRWAKYDVELEEADIADSAREAGLEFDRFTLVQKFNFARLLCAVLLYGAFASDYPEAQGSLAEARQRFNKLCEDLP